MVRPGGRRKARPREEDLSVDALLGAEACALPTIPLIDAREGGSIAIIDAVPALAAALVAAGRRRYGRLGLGLGDGLSRRWLGRNDNPYAAEIEMVAARVGAAGSVLLNMSYEWGCTTGVGADPAGVGSRLLRTLDWPLAGLGNAVVVARRRGEAGEYYDVTWPGFVGVATAMAPGRFSAALNQPPMRRYTASCAIDWVINRARVWRSAGMPPPHLLRRVFDTCATYAEAREMLATTALCIPAFFTLSGAEASEGCVLERSEDGVVVHEGPTSVANHWMALKETGWDRGTDSVRRRALMEARRDRAPDDLSWVVEPILNATTRLALMANAGRGTLRVRGFEADGPVTAVFEL